VQKAAPILLLILLSATIPGLAQSFRFNVNGNLVTQSPFPYSGTVGSSFKLEVSVTPINGVINDVSYTHTGTLPQGLNFSTVTNASGTVEDISGTPSAAGSANVTVTALVNLSGNIISGSLPINITTTPPVSVTAAPTSLTFPYFTDNLFPAIQFVNVTGAGGQAAVTVNLDDGNGGPAPQEFSVFPATTITTPGRLLVSFKPTSTTTSGTKSARLLLLPPGGTSIDIPLSASVTSRTPTRAFVPNYVAFHWNSGQTGVLHRKLIALQPLTVSFKYGFGFLVTPASTIPAVSSFDVAADLAQVAGNGPFNGLLGFSSIGGPVYLPSFGEGSDRAKLFAYFKQSYYKRWAGSSASLFGTATIYNIGGPGSVLNFHSSVAIGDSGTGFLKFGNATLPQDGTGTATPDKPYHLNLNLTSGNQPGLQQALFTVSEQGDPFNAFQSVVSLETSATAPVQYSLTPPTLVFVNNGGSTPLTKTFTLSTTGAGTSFTAAANAGDGGSGISVSPAAGTLSSLASRTLTVTLPSQFQRILSGSVDIAVEDGSFVSENFFVISPGAVVTGKLHPEASGCAPTQVLVAPGISSGFSRSVGFAEGLSAQIYDDCGNALTGPENTVVAMFDNGDPPVILENVGVAAGEADYLGSWTPLKAQSNVTITFLAASGNLSLATAGVPGSVTPNQFNAPVLFDGGTVNNTNPFGGPVLAPGMVTSVYGLNLASSPASPGVIPLPDVYNGTTLTIGGKPAPFYYLSNGQLNVQAPADLPAGQPTPVAVQVKSAFAVLPRLVEVFAAAPGVSSFSDEHIIAQHADFTLVDASHPAKPNEVIVMYLSGMGGTTASVATGHQAPNGLDPAQIQPVVTVGGQAAAVGYAGFTPQGIGLYQINFTTPANLSAGDAEVLVTQNGIIANRTLLPVGAP